MSKSSAAANVIDLEAFRQKKREEEERTNAENAVPPAPAVMLPVWICWVPVWTPVMA